MTLEIVHTERAYVVHDRGEDPVIVQLCDELDQARTELKRVQDAVKSVWANNSCLAADYLSSASQLRTELAQARDELARERRIAKATMVELKRVHESAHEDAEGLRQQLARTEVAADELRAELNDGYAKLAVAGIAFTDDDSSTWHNLSERIGRLLERLATLDAAEAALATERALRQVAETSERATMKVLGGERQLRYVAEQRAELADALAASTREALEWLWGFYDGNTLIAKPGYEDDIREAWDRLLAATDGVETVSLLGRLERAEALAALVTPRLGELLERLAWCAEMGGYSVAAEHGHEYAARIGEALDDSQA